MGVNFTINYMCITDYIYDEKRRHLLNDLTRLTFGFDFEEWVTKGYSDSFYVPYSYVSCGRMISNVSANYMHFYVNGEKKRYLQLGTVMTREIYRNRGLASSLIKKILYEEAYRFSGVYLFGNDSAVEFYKHLGFKEGKEFRYSINCKGKGKGTSDFVKLPKGDIDAKLRYMDFLMDTYPNSALALRNFGLKTFWTRSLDTIYYSKRLDCYISMVREGDIVYLNDVSAKKKVKVINIIKNMDPEVSKVILGFTPVVDEMKYYEVEEYHKEDTHLLYLDNALDFIEENKFMFPVYSHA